MAKVDEPKALKAIKSAFACGYWVDPVLGVVYGPQGNPLTPAMGTSGYLTVGLKGYAAPVHKVVAYCVYGDKVFGGHKVHVRHLDEDKQNNGMDNLMLGSARDNSRDVSRSDRTNRSLKAWQTRRRNEMRSAND